MSQAEPAERSHRVSTGVPGFDEILGSGLVPGRFYVVEGEPGTGKTTLALHFALAASGASERCLYITLSESAEELQATAASHGWSLDGLDLFEFLPADEGGTDERYTMYHPAEVELGETVGRILERVAELRPARIVLDSLSELRLMSDDALRYRRQILAMKRAFARLGATAMVLDDRMGERRDMQLYSLAHGLIDLEQRSPDYGATRRRLRIAKIRGQLYVGGYHDYIIRTGGVDLFPRLVARCATPDGACGVLRSGLESLDALLGGGLPRAASTLLLGPSGAGKSTVATAVARTALEGGERVHWFLFDEAPATFRQRAAGLGMSVDAHIDAGRLNLRQVNPAELSPGEFADAVRRAVTEGGSSLIVIDSLAGYLYAMASDLHLMLHLHELLAYLGQSGVATLLLMSQHGVLGEAASLDISYVADTVIQLRFFEAFGEVRQAISVIKKRTGDHERTIRELRFGGPRSIRIGEPLREFHGVLRGSPAFIGSSPAAVERT